MLIVFFVLVMVAIQFVIVWHYVSAAFNAMVRGIDQFFSPPGIR